MKFKKLSRRVLAYSVIFLFFSIGKAGSQCSLACNGSTQVSLDASCEARILYSTISSDQSSCQGGSFVVEIEDEYGLIPDYDNDGFHDVVGKEYCGKTLKARVIDTNSGNVCWGYILIEDKLGPIADCPMSPETVVFNCAEMANYAGPVFTECGDTIAPVLLSETISTLCTPTTIKNITRTYNAVDDKGNVSDEICIVNIQLSRIDFTDIEYPDSYLISNNTDLDCSGNPWDTNNNDYPDPEEVGSPYIVDSSGDTLRLYPFPDVYCNAVVTFDDTVLPKIGCTQKIMRRWTVTEWHCIDGDVDTSVVQTIEITDDQGPDITCGANITISTNTLTGGSHSNHYGDVGCAATLRLTLPTATDNCSDRITFDVLYEGGFVNGYNGTQDVTLPMGHSVVKFTAYDECYNSSDCSVHVNVVDHTPPVAVCDQHTVVSLTTGGEAVVNATSFNDGSYDDCKEHCMLVRRMTPNNCPCKIPEFCDLTYLGNQNGSYYYLSDYEISSDIAKARAAAYGGNLCFFDNYAEEQWVTTEVRKTYAGRFWIGAKRVGNAFHWDDHSFISYSNWASAQPSLGVDDNCVMVTPGNKWNDASCVEEHRYVFEIKDICGFSQIANFCCADAGIEQMVTFRVVDIFGNYNDCMVNVNVQDKLAPTVICPPDRTVDCDQAYDIANLDYFGTATVTDDCGASISSNPIDEVNQCNVGRIVRVFTATDNGGRESTCKQIITFDNDDLFDGNDIRCPRDTTIIGCESPEDLGPDLLGYPIYTSDQCNLVGSDWDDDVYTFNNNNSDACLKILRNWEIVDWCQTNPATGLFPKWYCNQVIKIRNTQKPEFLRGCDPVQVCVYDSECVDGYVELEVEANDDCTLAENLRWRYEIHAGQLGLGPADLNNPIVVNEGDGPIANASGKYPIGSHVVIWTFFDRCGNSVTCNQPFTVQNCKAPTAYCINGLSVDLMPMDLDLDGTIDFGMVELWASDFDAGSYHPCGLDVHLSFSADTSDRNILFDCNTFAQEASSGNYTDVDIWVSVEGPDGIMIQTFCSTYIDVQDNNGACSGLRPVVSVDGSIYTEELENVGNVEVNLEGSSLSDMTNSDGSYAFPNMPTGGAYTINPYSNVDPLNGVSTLDLLTIQKHVLGIEEIASPYRIIAADINKDSELTALDLIELRQLILGIHDDFPNNDSWRFVDKDYEFQDARLPLQEQFTEDYRISSLNSDMNIDFIAIKVGDVNGSINMLRNDEQIEKRNAKKSNIVYSADNLELGENIVVPFYSSSQSLTGYQFALEYNSDLVEIVEVRSSNNTFGQSNYTLDGNVIKLSWNNITPAKVGQEMFEVVCNVKQDIEANELFALSNETLTAEVYSEKGDIAIPVISTMNIEEGFDRLVVYQNTPNPFSIETQVDFNMPNDGLVNISLVDIDGRVIRAERKEYGKGRNTISFYSSDIGGSGIYYLTLEYNEVKETIKMVIVK